MPSGPVDQVADRYVSEWAALDPVGATTLGIAGPEAAVTDYSPEGHQARADLARRTLAAVDAAAGAAPAPLAADILRERLESAVALHDSGFLAGALNPVAGPVQDLRLVFAMMPTATADDWDVLARRLAGVGAALAGLARSLRAAAAGGTVAARRQVLAVAAQCEAWSGRTPTGLSAFDTLTARAWTVPGAPAAHVQAVAVQAAAEFGRFAEFLRTRLLPLAPADDAVGSTGYGLWLRSSLGDDVDPIEAYEWGRVELCRTGAVMRAVARRVSGGDCLAASVAALDADPRYRIGERAEFLAWLRLRAEEAVERLADRHVDLPAEARRVECRLAPDGEGPAAYYTPPAPDRSRPGLLWWTVAPATTVATWRALSRLYHEGVPGHHLQAVSALAEGKRLNLFRRQLCDIPGYGEGWALYAERLMGELGFLCDVGHRFGMLQGQALRAARVVVDIGLHLRLRCPPDAPHGPGETWTRASAVAFLRQHTAIPAAEAEHEVDRCLGWPGQAPSYKLGERAWLAVRSAVQRGSGAAFDLRRFHRDALALGPMGLALLRRQFAHTPRQPLEVP